jgi:3'(2'), 5'-bisphosphate nucleotidase
VSSSIAAPSSTTQLGASDLDALLAGAKRLAAEAAAAIMAIYATPCAVTHKSDSSPLTAADTASHAILDAGLKQLEPRFPVLSEESSPRIFQDRSRWRRFWLIDPLDGTREFVARNGEFAINIALIENGAPILGLIHSPVHDTTWFASRSEGAWRTQGTGNAQALRTHKMAPGDVPRVLVSRSHCPPELSVALTHLGAHIASPLGASLKFCAIAAAEQDLYPRQNASSSEWDIAAGQCVLELAGGAVLDQHGMPLRYNQGANLLMPAFLAVGDASVPWRERLRWPMLPASTA